MNVRSLEKQATIINTSGSYLRFKHALLGVNEQATAQERRFSGVRRAVGATDYFNGSNIVAGSQCYQAMPAAQHKSGLLRYGFQLAKQPDSHRGMTLGVAVLVTHPFANGNGRTSRLIHATHLGYSAERIIESGLFTPHDDESSDHNARRRIDLKPPQELAAYAESEIYKAARLSREPFRPALYDEHVPRTVNMDAYLAEQENEADPLHNSLRFGLNALHASGYEIPVAYEAEDIENPGKTLKTVDAIAFVNGLGTRGRLAFLAKAREYRRLRAKTWIDCTSESTATGNQRLTLDSGSTKTVAAHFLDLTNNLYKHPLTSPQEAQVK